LFAKQSGYTDPPQTEHRFKKIIDEAGKMEFLVNAGKMINTGLKAAPEIRRGSIFARMSRYELVEYCRSLYIQGGIEALSYASRGGKIADGIL